MERIDRGKCVIWVGKIQWKHRVGGVMTTKEFVCEAHSNFSEGVLDINGTGWPETLISQFLPKSVLRGLPIERIKSILFTQGNTEFIDILKAGHVSII